MDKKQQTRERVQRYRERQKSVTSDSVTSVNVTHDWGEPKVLSDGQLWWPGHMGLHPPGCECGITHMG